MQPGPPAPPRPPHASEAQGPRTLLALVRHGEAESNRDGRFGGHSDAALTPLGHAQAAATATALLPFEATAIIASDLPRARDTAGPIVAATGLPLQLDPALRERSLGVFDGLRFDDAERRYPAEWARLLARDHSVVPPGGETVEEVYQRVSAAIDRIVASHPGGRVVVVSHGLAMFHAFAHIWGIGSPARELQVFVLVDNCSISRVEHRSGISAGRWRILSINESAHLRGVTAPPP